MQCTHNHILNVWRQKETSETIIGRDFAFADKRHVNNKNAIYNFQHAVAISFFHSSTSKNNAHLPLIIFNELITIYFGNLQICQDTLFIYSDYLYIIILIMYVFIRNFLDQKFLSIPCTINLALLEDIFTVFWTLQMLN